MPRQPKPKTTLATSKPTREKIPRAAKALANRLIRGEAVPKKFVRRVRKRRQSEDGTQASQASQASQSSTPSRSSSKSPKKKSKPSYLAMAVKAIKENSGKNGASLLSISRYVNSNYPVSLNYKAFLRGALQKGVDDNILVKTGTMYNVRESTIPISKIIKEKRKKSKKETKTTKPKKRPIRKTSATPSKSLEKSSSPKEKAKKTRAKKVTTRKTRDATKRGSSKSKKPATAPTAKRKLGTTKRVTRSTTGVKRKAKSKKDVSRKKGRLGKEGEDLIWTWQFKENDNKFHNYDSRASDIVEGVYQEYLTTPHTTDVRAVKSGDWEYMVDFRLMTQQNIQHASHTVRKIRRVQIPLSEKNNRKLAYDDDE